MTSIKTFFFWVFINIWCWFWSSQQTGEEGWSLLLALSGYMHSGAAYLHEVWAWWASSFTCQFSITIWYMFGRGKKDYVLQTVCLTFSNLSRAVSWPNAYLADHLLELGWDCTCDFLAFMVMEESPKIQEKAAVIDCKNLSQIISIRLFLFFFIFI